MRSGGSPAAISVVLPASPVSSVLNDLVGFCWGYMISGEDDSTEHVREEVGEDVAEEGKLFSEEDVKLSSEVELVIILVRKRVTSLSAIALVSGFGTSSENRKLSKILSLRGGCSLSILRFVTEYIE